MKLLYNKTTQLLQPLNCSDGLEPVGLEPIYEVFNVIQGSAPESVDAGMQVRPTQSINVAAKTVTQGYEVVVIEQPPLSVSMTSLKLALDEVGMYESVAAAIASAPFKMQILWLNTTAARDNPDLNQFATSLGLTDAQVDAIFSSAQGKDRN